jgi:hypothetical protein
MNMHATNAVKPVDQIISAIQALDLETVKSRVMDAELGEGWTREYADSVESAYKTFLTMLIKYPEDSEDIMLAKDVDEFWHTHILQTRKYTNDCERTFGFYLHHNPHVGERTAADLAKREELAAKTQQLYAREFGSAQRAEAAWAGDMAKPGTAAAFSSGPGIAAIRAGNAAFSSGPGMAAIRAGNAAFSSGPGVAAIRAENAAFSSGPGIAAISAKNAAFSSGPGIAAISARNAAFSSGPGITAIRAENAAFSSGPGMTAVRAENAVPAVAG